MLRLMTQAWVLTDLSGAIKSAKRELENTLTSVSENTATVKASRRHAAGVLLFREHRDCKVHKVLKFLLVVNCWCFIHGLLNTPYGLGKRKRLKKPNLVICFRVLLC